MPARSSSGLLAQCDASARADDVEIHPPAGDWQPWLVQQGTGAYFRVGADVAWLLGELDGQRSVSQLAADLGTPWTPQTVKAAVSAFAAHGWLADGRLPRRRPHRLTYVRPLTLQLTLFDPSRLLGRVRSALAWLTSPAAVLLPALGALSSVGVVLTHRSEIAPAMRQLPTPGAALAAAVAVLVSIVAHEFGHAAMLTAHGGRPRRMGLMLFYGLPAAFCDVSDGWRLPRRGQRVAVALAGVATEITLAGAAALTAVCLPAGQVRTVLLVYTLGCLVRSLFNLMPFARLDGYLALMSALDLTHLRDKAMRDAQRAVGRLLFGGTYRRELPQLCWALPYGAACQLFPVGMLTYAIWTWAGRRLVISETALHLVVTTLAVLLAARLLMILRGAHAEACAAGTTPRRRQGVTAALAAVIACLPAILWAT
ncbi:hypothetical protein J7F01_15220 [Streptomyces sp. ISL-22]|uniref:daptide biosynthesis intramembrane metalloprotease n=1 Tax=unclassified Streptomyces TaxID=2593676 RepID=UPI001BE7B8DE|nr:MULTISPECIES: daptide biosynthesis intramembrane metalloprotease [unclassified Streptomyces]MBT2423792.1 hypothetical protein [Streptomyces sp. ISL-24]MBT2433512.1 hypothetical protein [Streptomyces sp. ISL-22]